jgi:lipopolysaccharide export system permease protein
MNISLGRLDRYIVRSILEGVLLVALVLMSLGLLFLFLGQQDDIGRGTYGFADALWFSLLNMPQQVWDLLPISALIGGMLALGNLARGSELIVMRASGWSMGRFLRPVTVAGLLLVMLGTLVGEWLAPPMQQLARQHKLFSKFEDVSFAGRGEAWVRDGSLIINIERQSGSGQYGGMMIYEINAQHRLSSLGRAATASVDAAGGWSLDQYAESRFDAETVQAGRKASHSLQSNLSTEFIGIAATTPSDLPSAALWRLWRHLATNQLDTEQTEFAFWSRIARGLAPIAALWLALPFAFGSLRSAGAGGRVAVGLAIGIGFFLMQKMLESGVTVFGGHPFVWAWLPTGLMVLAAWLLLRRVGG